MVRKASIFRLEAETQAALSQLARLLGRPMNKLVNEAVKDYLLKVGRQERELGETLAHLRDYRERAIQVRETSPAYVSCADDAAALDAARDFVRRVKLRYSVTAAFLFGSRARNTHRADSDVDVAVIVRGVSGKLIDIALEMADIAFDVLLETGAYVQPVPIRQEAWDCPETHSNPSLLAEIRRDGISL
jgi:predicted nucleotidyltransferase/predicted transcriptional regulator